jgi:P2 family phage contractile tail tube protein
MGAAPELKNLTAWADGVNYLGIIKEFEEPKLAIAMDSVRYGGMPGSVKTDRGLEDMQAVMTMGGHVKELIRKFGITSVDGVKLRLVGAYLADDGSVPEAVEIYIGGRFSEIDFGSSKLKSDTEHKYTVPLAYYRRVVDGVDEIEIDMINGVFIVGGVDRYGGIMAILTS